MRTGLIVAVVAAILVLSGCGGGSDDASSATPEAVSVHVSSPTSDDAFALEKLLAAEITKQEVGGYDETRWHATAGGGEAQLLAYGPDADALWEVMKPIVKASDSKPGGYVIKTYSDASEHPEKQVRISLTP